MKYVFNIDRLRLKFSEKRMTYRELGELSGISYATVHSIFTRGNDLPPTITHLLLLCNALEVSPRTLFNVK